jgi:hypothetical protein
VFPDLTLRNNERKPHSSHRNAQLRGLSAEKTKPISYTHHEEKQEEEMTMHCPLAKGYGGSRRTTKPVPAPNVD